METTHEVVVGDARSMDALDEDSVELVVTSPPYPMIELWDDVFAALDEGIADRLDAEDGRGAFELMHEQLDEAWAEVARVLVDGGIAAINVGDATRTLDSFRCYPNHVRVVRAFTELGFDVLPPVQWRKSTNSPTKFMGSGTLPPNAYVTLEHEQILLFRNGDRRSFEPGATRRYESAFFWEERNEWFSDLWEVTGERQALDGGARDRSAAFPLEIPYRLVNMFSAHGDTVLDPFWGTGTTTLAAMASGRHSAGYEIDAAIAEAFEAWVDDVPAMTRERNRDRIERHREFVRERTEAGSAPGYEATHYDVPVVTKQERDVRFYDATDVAAAETETGWRYLVTHEPFELRESKNAAG